MNSTNTSAELGNSSAEFGADRNLGAHEQEQSVYETLPSHGSLGESSRLAGMDSSMLVGATVTQGSALIGAVLIVAMLLFPRCRRWSAALLPWRWRWLWGLLFRRRKPDAASGRRDSDVGAGAAIEMVEVGGGASKVAPAAASVAAEPPLLHVPKLLGSSSSPPSVISHEQVCAVCRALPPRLTLCDWTLLYSTEQHGCSLRTCYRQLEGRHGPNLVLVLDDGGRLFGAFASEALRCERHYFGTGETFLFSLAPSFAAYRWTRQNSHYVLGGHDSLAFGGGGAFGLYLDASFERGSSARCDTFGNEPLGSSPEFGVVKVEVWGFR